MYHSVGGVRQRHLVDNPLVFHGHRSSWQGERGKGIETAQNHATSLEKGDGSAKQRPWALPVQAGLSMT